VTWSRLGLFVTGLLAFPRERISFRSAVFKFPQKFKNFPSLFDTRSLTLQSPDSRARHRNAAIRIPRTATASTLTITISFLSVSIRLLVLIRLFVLALSSTVPLLVVVSAILRISAPRKCQRASLRVSTVSVNAFLLELPVRSYTSVNTAP
jgi:hypothetical protein